MKMKIYMLAAALLLSAPAFAADDQEMNSGFGSDLFAGKSAPAFEDPDFFDIDSLANMAPAAGDETVPPAENAVDGTAAAAKGSAAETPATGAPAIKGISGTFSTR